MESLPRDLQELSLLYLTSDNIKKHPLFNEFKNDLGFRQRYLNDHFKTLRNDHAYLHLITYEDIINSKMILRKKYIDLDAYNKSYMRNTRDVFYRKYEFSDVSRIEYIYNDIKLSALSSDKLNVFWQEILNTYLDMKIFDVDIYEGDFLYVAFLDNDICLRFFKKVNNEIKLVEYENNLYNKELIPFNMFDPFPPDYFSHIPHFHSQKTLRLDLSQFIEQIINNRGIDVSENSIVSYFHYKNKKYAFVDYNAPGKFDQGLIDLIDDIVNKNKYIVYAFIYQRLDLIEIELIKT